MFSSSVLLIEDDVLIQELVKFNLEKEGFALFVSGSGRQGLEMARAMKPNLILLDLMLPDLDGFEVCKALRADESMTEVPIIILSAKGEVVDKVIGLELGADDYITKPFSTRELSARIRARLRGDKQVKENTQDGSKVIWGELEIWPLSYIVTLGGDPVNLTVKEFQLLLMLVSHPYQVFSREYLLEKIWGYSVNGDTRTVDVHISTLRAKLKRLESVLESVRGIGYRFASPVSGSRS